MTANLLPNFLLQNRYLIVRQIGRGGMGAVYEAIDQHLGHTVAVKQIMRGDPHAFEQEARLLARLRHPGLPSVSDHFVETAGQFLVMEFIPGNDLATEQLLKKAKFTLKHVLIWADHLLDVLNYLHKHQPPVIHSDIKPANLKRLNGERLILLDFGLASAALARTPVAGKPAQGYTPHYSSPEQMHRESLGEPLQPQSDLYSAAATLYNLLTGNKPPDANLRIKAVGTSQPDPLEIVLEQSLLPQVVTHVLRKGMALQAKDRYTSAQVMRAALRATGHNNLPTPPTPLLGRDAQLVELQQLVQHPNIRLVTLTGPGGIGKSHLSLQAGFELLEQFPDGIFFVALASLREANLMLDTIALTLGLRETGEKSLAQQLRDDLRDRQSLLILDNFEQIIAAAPAVAELLAACPQLKIIATSRQPLHLRGEYEFPVPPLSLPDLAHLPAIAALAQFAAVELFVQRTQAVNYGFVLDQSNAAAVAEICVLLEGLPLAIELAAVRTRQFTAQAMLLGLTSALGARFNLLRDGPRDLPDRQRTLQATIDWSYDLLSNYEQRLFLHLAVFSGGCTLEAAETIGFPIGDLLTTLSSLINKSLLRQIHGNENEPRYEMLVTIHEYAGLRLSERSEVAALRHRHLNYYLAQAEASETRLVGAEQMLWLQRLEAEHDNLRTALAWAEAQKKYEIGLRFSGSLWRFWEAHGHLSEGRQWLECFLALSAEQSPGRAKALNALGILAYIQGDLATARHFHQESLTIRRVYSLPQEIAGSLNNLGIVHKEQGDLIVARQFFEESLHIRRALGDERQIATSLVNLGTVVQRQADYAAAYALYNESLAIFRKLGDKRAIITTLINLGWTVRAQGDEATARSLWQEGAMLARELGYQWGIATCLLNWGNSVRLLGDFTAARPALVESLQIMQRLSDKIGVAYAIEGLGFLLATQGQSLDALRLLAAASSLRTQTGAPLPALEQTEFDHFMTLARQGTLEATAAAAWETGRAMTLEEMIAHALQSERK